MVTPPKPDNEDERLAALDRYRVVASAIDDNEFDEITKFVARICDTPIATLSFVEASRQWFKSSRGLHATETTRDVSFCGHAILNPSQVMVVEDATQDERFADNPLVTGDPNIRFYAGAPLVTDDGFPLGTLCVMDAKARPMTADEEDTLRLASRTVIKILEQRLTITQLQIANEFQKNVEAELREEIAERKRVQEELNFTSTHDSLTLIPNRGRFAAYIDEALKCRIAGDSMPFAICFIDLDHFKHINDTLGHLAGDDLLREIARRLTTIKRSRDLVARIGGDEFIVFLAEIDSVDAVYPVADRIMKAFAPPVTLSGIHVCVTASVGALFVDQSYKSLDEIIHDADVAMYKSKAAGRNQYTVFTAEMR